jgi:hypothetical protein
LNRARWAEIKNEVVDLNGSVLKRLDPRQMEWAAMNSGGKTLIIEISIKA